MAKPIPCCLTCELTPLLFFLGMSRPSMFSVDSQDPKPKPNRLIAEGGGGVGAAQRAPLFYLCARRTALACPLARNTCEVRRSRRQSPPARCRDRRRRTRL